MTATVIDTRVKTRTRVKFRSRPARTVTATVVRTVTGSVVAAQSGGGGGSNCTPGYSPCLPYEGGADYDCAGGSGNGPYYTASGVVYRVTGSDPYGLDADGDGSGCE